jgi:hypothetical protein
MVVRDVSVHARFCMYTFASILTISLIITNCHHLAKWEEGRRTICLKQTAIASFLMILPDYKRLESREADEMRQLFEKKEIGASLSLSLSVCCFICLEAVV